jgi:hypothetical protein
MCILSSNLNRNLRVASGAKFLTTQLLLVAGGETKASKAQTQCCELTHAS